MIEITAEQYHRIVDEMSDRLKTVQKHKSIEKIDEHGNVVVHYELVNTNHYKQGFTYYDDRENHL